MEKKLRLSFVGTVLLLLVLNGALSFYESGRVKIDTTAYDRITAQVARDNYDKMFSSLVKFSVLDLLKMKLKAALHKDRHHGK